MDCSARTRCEDSRRWRRGHRLVLEGQRCGSSSGAILCPLGQLESLDHARIVRLLGIFEVGPAAIWRVDAFEVQVAATLAWLVAIAFDLTPLALVTASRLVGRLRTTTVPIWRTKLSRYSGCALRVAVRRHPRSCVCSHSFPVSLLIVPCYCATASKAREVVGNPLGVNVRMDE